MWLHRACSHITEFQSRLLNNVLAPKQRVTLEVLEVVEMARSCEHGLLLRNGSLAQVSWWWACGWMWF